MSEFNSQLSQEVQQQTAELLEGIGADRNDLLPDALAAILHAGEKFARGAGIEECVVVGLRVVALTKEIPPCDMTLVRNSVFQALLGRTREEVADQTRLILSELFRVGVQDAQARQREYESGKRN